MPEYFEGNLTFDFPETFVVQKYDDSTFFVRQFQKISRSVTRYGRTGDTRAVDFLAFDPQKPELWLLEVRDYNKPDAEKPLEELVDDIVQKTLDTLAGLIAMRSTANLSEEQNFAKQALKQTKLRIVLHLEQPRTPSKVFPQAVDPADLKQELKKRLQAIDFHPLVSSIGILGAVPWTVK
jgi:hypothetical protein